MHHLNVYNTDLDGVPAWNTNDIILRHPTNKDIYRFVGRSDDQIMLSSGQKVGSLNYQSEAKNLILRKTNPGPLGNRFQVKAKKSRLLINGFYIRENHQPRLSCA